MSVTVLRDIPPGSTPLVVAGQRVTPDTTLATLDVEMGPVRTVDCAARLGCQPRELGRHLLVKAGEHVSRGQWLASRNLFETPVVAVSPCHGRVSLLSTRLGFVYLREDPPRADGPISVDLSQVLHVPRGLCRDCIRVKKGDRVVYGRILAAVPAAVDAPMPVDMVRQHTLAPVTGVVSEVSPDSSVVTIEPAPPRIQVKSLVAGVVERVVPGRNVAIATAGWQVAGTFGIRGPVSGELAVAGESTDLAGGPDRVADKVVLVREPPDAELLRALEAAGARAVVAPHMDQLELVRYLGREIRLGITPAEEGRGLTLILLGGFAGGEADGPGGSSGDGTAAFARLEAAVGRMAYLDGQTHIRAGARRPLVVVLEAEEKPTSEAKAQAAGLPTLTPDGAGATRRPVLSFWSRVVPPQPAARWVYPCLRPRTAQAFRLRFPGAPAPQGEALPGERTMENYPGVPVLTGAVAARLSELAVTVASGAAPVLGEALRAFPPEALGGRPASGGSPPPWAPLLLLGGALLRALREGERRAGLWSRRSDAEKLCPAFILRSDSPATVIRAVPNRGGACFLVPLGPTAGWDPWHLILLGRSDVGLDLQTVDDSGRIQRMTQGFVILKGLGVVRSFMHDASGQLASRPLDPESVAPAEAWLAATARRLAAGMDPHWERLAAVLDEMTASTGTGRGGDLVEAFYACLTDAFLVAAGERGWVAPFAKPPSSFLVATAPFIGRRVSFDASDGTGLFLEKSNSWPLGIVRP